MVRVKSFGPRRTGAVLALLIAAAGCSAPQAETSANNDASSSPLASAPSSITPAGAVTLRQLLIRNGPEGFLLPDQIATTSRIDQPNVVTLTFDAEAGTRLADFLAATLPRTGWSVEAHKDTSLLFHDDDVAGEPWEGAFTCSQTSCALTLRNQ